MWSHVDWLQTPRKVGSKVEDEDMSDLSCRTRERVSGTTGGGGEASRPGEFVPATPKISERRSTGLRLEVPSPPRADKFAEPRAVVASDPPVFSELATPESSPRKGRQGPPNVKVQHRRAKLPIGKASRSLRGPRRSLLADLSRRECARPAAFNVEQERTLEAFLGRLEALA